LVIGLLPILALLFLGVAVVLWAGTVVIQGYIYSEPVEQAYWRAPVTALVVTLFVAFWCSLDYKSPGRYGSFFDVASASDDTRFDKFLSVKNNRETVYTFRKDAKGRGDYYDDGGRKWNRADTDGIVQAIIVEDKDGQKIRFEADLTKDGKFKLDPDRGTARYVEASGKHRVMTDSAPGWLSVPRTGVVAANLLLNLVHGIVWFLCLWLLLRFQWGHALGLAFVGWLVLTFFLPPLFKRTEDLAKQKAAQATASIRLSFPAGTGNYLPPGTAGNGIQRAAGLSNQKGL
jgi:hypothetical protein